MTSIADQLPRRGRVLIIRLRSLGDCVLTTPAISLLHDYRPDLMIAVMAGGAFVLSRMVLGRHIYALGGNAEAAWLAGINIRGITWIVYTLNGALAGLGGLVLASRLGAGVPNAGIQYELDVIAAVVVGGTSLSGGRGSIGSTLWGTVFIGVLTNGLNLANVDPYVQKIALGVVIVIAVIADQVGRRRAETA